MSMNVSSCAAAPPLPITGGGAIQSPLQAPVTAGGASAAPAQSPMQVPMGPAAMQGAAGGGALVQPAPAQPAPVVEPAAAPVSAAPVPVAGGGPVADLQAILPALQQVTASLSALASQLQGSAPAAQAQAGATGVAGESGAGTATVEGGGATIQQGAPGAGCCCATAKGAAGAVQQDTAEQAAKPKDDRPAEHTAGANAAPEPAAAAGGGGTIDPAAQTVKGAKMTLEQAKLTETVLRVGKEMGANRKVLETAVSTMIQESTIRNDASVDTKDHDSLGLFQQRPSAGWGTREQISNPEYAARKFFEKAIPNDQKNPDQAKTRLAQSVQISAFPDAYAQWDKEAEKIVADYLG